MPNSRARKVRHAVLTSACLAFAAAGLPMACSSKTPEEPVISGCRADSECLAGQHCENGLCRQNCSATANDCPAGETCGADGRCTATPTGGTGGGGGGGGMSGTSAGGTIHVVDSGADVDVDADACATATVDFTVQPPNVMLVVDRSGSMAEELDPMNQPGLQRWQAAREALVNATTGVVPLVQATVNLGLTLYTAPTGMTPHVGHMNTVGTADPDYTETTTCPFLVQVPIALNNFTAIEAAYRPITMYSNLTLMNRDPDRLPAGATPTGESIQAVIPVMQVLDPVMFPGPKAIVLATDGEPNGCDTMTTQGRQNSVNAVQAAFDANIRTFVISVGSDVGRDHLRELANIGQGFPGMDPMDRFYLATDPAALADALRKIFTEVRSCTFMVDGTIDLDRAGTGVVVIDGMPITFGDANGWRANSETEIEILGTACDTIKMGEHNVEIRFPCGVIEPP